MPAPIGRNNGPVATTPTPPTPPAPQPDPTNPAWAPGTRPGTRPTGPSMLNPRFAGDAQLGAVLAGGTLTSGAKGEGVKKLQQAMTDMGFALPNAADGSFGPMSAKAVKNFQVNASKMFPDVKPTGIVDAATLRALDSLAPAAGQQGQSKNVPVPFFEGKPVRVVVLKDEHRTFLFDKQGKLEKILMNAVGAKATSTDEGFKKVTTKLGEAESLALGQRLWGGPVFGPRLLDLSWADGSRSGEELHGTSNNKQLGEDVSHGCVRHSNEDILKLYDALKVGDHVAIVSGLKDARLRH
ncbi:MAG: L,D-transpeptidase family protein [Archangium sp.]|nr:L,D-transpeptidase family protein [Archangium sp.]MDP3573786.1 L,D-transpeptidase family protein [Archangium sp.]